MNSTLGPVATLIGLYRALYSAVASVTVSVYFEAGPPAGYVGHVEGFGDHRERVAPVVRNVAPCDDPDLALAILTERLRGEATDHMRRLAAALREGA